MVSDEAVEHVSCIADSSGAFGKSTFHDTKARVYQHLMTLLKIMIHCPIPLLIRDERKFFLIVPDGAGFERTMSAA